MGGMKFQKKLLIKGLFYYKQCTREMIFYKGT
jgi:hypothetical protein